MGHEDTARLIDLLRSLASPRNREGMGRFGINTRRALGVPMPELRKLARLHRRDHVLAGELWASGIHEARILACLVDDPALVTEAQMEQWVSDFDSWDLCDQCCMNLFDRTPFAVVKALEWSGRGEEFVKRAGFALMASLAVHDKQAEDKLFLSFLTVILGESTDERNFVRKAVNWALRQTGKRNRSLNGAALKTAGEMALLESKSARWNAADAIRELRSDKVQKKIGGVR